MHSSRTNIDIDVDIDVDVDVDVDVDIDKLSRHHIRHIKAYDPHEGDYRYVVVLT